MTSSTRLTAFAAVIALALAPLVSVATAAPPARADDPGLALTVAGGGGASLAGDDTAYMLTARNTTANDLFNLSFSMDVPVGVTFVSSMLGEPVAYDDIEDVPGEPVAAAGMVRWVWQNAADLPASASYDLTVTVHPEQPIPGVPRFTTDQTVFPVGSSFVVDSAAYASSDPRFIPVFNGSTGVGGQGAIDVTTASAVVPTSKCMTPITITKSERSPEAELLRGAHDQTTVYTLTVDNNKGYQTSGAVVTAR